MSLMMLPLGLAMHTSCSDAELVERLQRRDPQALAELYDRYGGPIYSLILGVVRDPGLAEDVVQEIYLRAWSGVAGLDAQSGSIGPWLMTVAHNLAIERARSGGGVGETTGVPPARLRRRILAAVGFEQSRFGWAPFWAGAAVLFLAAAVYFSGRERQFAEDLQRAQERLREQTVDLSRLNEAFSVIDAPDTMVAAFGEGRPVSGKVFANRSGVLLIASNMPMPPAGMALEMWVTPKGGKPARAGMFRPDASGASMHVSHRPCDPGDTVAATMETEAGVDRPTSSPIVSVLIR